MISPVAVLGPNSVPYIFSDPPSTDPGKRLQGKSQIKPNTTSRQRVLVVDDEDLIANSVAEILNRNGYDAVAKYSAKAAIQYVEEGCPDVIVSDVIMPDCNGIQLAKAIRLRCPGTRVVLFSGNAATSNLLDLAYDEGYFFELLPKPVHPLQLLKALKT